MGDDVSCCDDIHTNNIFLVHNAAMERSLVWRLRGEAVASCGNLDGVELLLKGTRYSITYNLTVLKWN